MGLKQLHKVRQQKKAQGACMDRGRMANWAQALRVGDGGGFYKNIGSCLAYAAFFNMDFYNISF